MEAGAAGATWTSPACAFSGGAAGGEPRPLCGGGGAW
jgi:hypothetical protein